MFEESIEIFIKQNTNIFGIRVFLFLGFMIDTLNMITSPTENESQSKKIEIFEAMFNSYSKLLLYSDLSNKITSEIILNFTYLLNSLISEIPFDLVEIQQNSKIIENYKQMYVLLDTNKGNFKAKTLKNTRILNSDLVILKSQSCKYNRINLHNIISKLLSKIQLRIMNSGKKSISQRMSCYKKDFLRVEWINSFDKESLITVGYVLYLLKSKKVIFNLDFFLIPLVFP